MLVLFKMRSIVPGSQPTTPIHSCCTSMVIAKGVRLLPCGVVSAVGSRQRLQASEIQEPTFSPSPMLLSPTWPYLGSITTFSRCSYFTPIRIHNPIEERGCNGDGQTRLFCSGPLHSCQLLLVDVLHVDTHARRRGAKQGCKETEEYKTK